ATRLHCPTTKSASDRQRRVGFALRNGTFSGAAGGFVGLRFGGASLAAAAPSPFRGSASSFVPWNSSASMANRTTALGPSTSAAAARTSAPNVFWSQSWNYWLGTSTTTPSPTGTNRVWSRNQRL